MANVLIVDDEPGVRSLLSRMVAAAGHEVRDAGDAEEALSAMTTAEAQVVLCDVRMPGQDGVWLVNEIRKRFPTAGLLFVTGETKLPASATLKQGVVAYITKPFEKEQIVDAIKSAFEWHQSALASPRPPIDDALETWLNEVL